MANCKYPQPLSLVYRRGGLGDTLLTFPILEALTNLGQNPIAVGNTDYFIIAKEIGWAIDVYSEIPKLNFTNQIKISLDGNVPPFPKGREWIVSHYFRALGLSPKFSKTLPLKPFEKSPLSGKAVLHPSSGSRKKNLPPELFLRIEHHLKALGYETIYLIGEADLWLTEIVKNYWQSSSPLEIARALKTSAIFIGADSGISHLASYCGVKTYILYGPTDPIIWKPIGQNTYQISLNLPCSPCFPNTCDAQPCLSPNLAELFFSLI
ncbi:MAG: glycosyltransferase family 9 protein [Aquificaceae bacterium]|nr:glycosyltransferase family 9 protein [Aquificaceae bacterium]